MTFTDRTEAGRRLTARLRHMRSSNMVVLGVSRGGVPVAYEVAQAFDAPLDVVVVQKLGVPFHPELAMGAIGEDGVRVADDDLATAVGVRAEDITHVEDDARAELARRVRLFRNDRGSVPLAGRTVIIVDDGVATGATAQAACQVARHRGAKWVVFAAPVAPFDAARALERYADQVACLTVPDRLGAVGYFYADFTPVHDADVVALLQSAAERLSARTTNPSHRRYAGR